MSRTALHIIQLVKSLPVSEQQAIKAALTSVASSPGSMLSEGGFEARDYEGLPDNDPFFAVIEQIEQQRHMHSGRPVPELD